MPTRLARRGVLLGALATPALLLAGCDRLSAAPSFRELALTSGERLSYRIHRAIGGGSLAREFAPSQMSPDFRVNGTRRPQGKSYARQEAEGFADWRLAIDGLVAAPRAYSLAELRSRPARSQITRHDCVEGWSAIGKWTGASLGPLLDEARLLPDARYVVFHCADHYGARMYYESIDLVDAFHPQTILAYGMNDADLSVGHGAPLRLRVERQLGYKQAKYVARVEAVASLAQIGDGKGGHWEDTGFYDWYAGI
jgi:DMSO/TMAO reductase YedYZ molybdopterin-dependent catalytic subunit